MKYLGGLALLMVALLVSGCGSSLVFYPMDPWLQTPVRQGLDYEDVIVVHEDGQRVHGWWLPASGMARGTVYFLHGNAQNISTHLMSVRWLPGAGFNVFLLDYRGYGMSDGEPSVPAALGDIQLGLDWLADSGRLDGKPLIVLGQSLGASLSMPVMARPENAERFDCLISEAAFTGYRSIANDVMKKNWLTWVLRPVVLPSMPGGVDPIESIGDIRQPMLVMHSTEDEVIGFDHGEQLFEAASEPKEFQPLQGRHIVALSDESVRQRVLQFIYSRCGAVDVPPLAPVNPGVNGAVQF